MARKSRKNPYLLNTELKEADICMVEERTARLADRIPTGAYIRLSAENSGNETDDTLQTQIALVESYIQRQEDLYLFNTYVDNGFTGTNFERPEFIRMMEDVKKGTIQCIVVKDLSRFGRNYLETGYYLETIFPLLNVRFIAVTDNFDSSREEDRNNLAIPIKNMVNAMYAKEFSRKQEVFQEMCRRTGRYVRKGIPYGYVYSEKNNRLEIDKKVEPYVRLVFAWTLAGVQRSEIARRMEVLGAPTAKTRDSGKDSRWTPYTVKGILSNPVYAGFHVMGKSRVSTYRGIKPVRIGREDWIYFPDFHEAYITMEDYKVIEGIISKNKSDRSQKMERHAESRERMQDCFPGMVFCADCGRKMDYYRSSHHGDNSDRSFQCYRCRYDRENKQSSNTFVQQNFLKIVVMDQLRTLIRAACDKKRVLESLQQKYGKPVSINPIERNIKRLSEKEKMVGEKQLKSYMDYAEGLLDEETYRIISQKHSREKEEIVMRRKEFEQRLEQVQKSVQRFRELAERLERYLDTSEFQEDLVKELVEKIIVSKDNRIELVLKCQDIFSDPLVDEYMGKGVDNL